MDFKRRLDRIEDKIDCKNKEKIMRISTLADVVRYISGRFPNDAKIVWDEKIKGIVKGCQKE